MSLHAANGHPERPRWAEPPRPNTLAAAAVPPRPPALRPALFKPPLGTRTTPAHPHWDHAASSPEHLYRPPAPVLSWAALPPKPRARRHGPEEP